MDFEINPLTIEERKYTYAQSQQLCGQTGSIGHLRGDFGSGEQFYTTWNEHNGRLKTPGVQFRIGRCDKQASQQCLRTVKEPPQYGGFCKEVP